MTTKLNAVTQEQRAARSFAADAMMQLIRLAQQPEPHGTIAQAAGIYLGVCNDILEGRCVAGPHVDGLRQFIAAHEAAR